MPSSNTSTGGQPPALVVGLHHVALRVLNLDQAARFYGAAAGFAPWPAAGALAESMGGLALCAPNAGLLLLPAGAAGGSVRRPVSEAGIAHLCLQTPAIQQVVSQMTAQGARLHSEPIDLGTGFLYCYARDPEHNVIEVECVAPVWGDPRPWVAHANIVTHDLPRLCQFYSALLGVEAVRSPRLRDDPRLDAIADLQGVQLRAAWLNAGNAQLELMQYLHPATEAATGRRTPGAAGFAHIAFEVADLAAACAHLRACGGAVEPAACASPWQARCTDPDGNPVLLLALDDGSRQPLRVQALADPQITSRFAAARAALPVSE
jgi:catechol 2,3-dioxygenase-like lactoylglutathione lyase family enzyme